MSQLSRTPCLVARSWSSYLNKQKVRCAFFEYKRESKNQFNCSILVTCHSCMKSENKLLNLDNKMNNFYYFKKTLDFNGAGDLEKILLFAGFYQFLPISWFFGMLSKVPSNPNYIEKNLNICKVMFLFRFLSVFQEKYFQNCLAHSILVEIE
ncbi:hypothetical protein BpHYR1_028642 [Brachionus plicatilis]|uniref:Uncharacterized protein n=1 Tax=Brachionus plicatilis TaxID=10195 RepID=A0A3M7RCY6_BRAPC|nr:hypothetical protein BpHYR1_028642 [Brachionus plicatilis]